MKIREELNMVSAEGIHSLVTTSKQMLPNDKISYIYHGITDRRKKERTLPWKTQCKRWTGPDGFPKIAAPELKLEERVALLQGLSKGGSGGGRGYSI